jgi:catechol 2,3-dioxygenase-like lactoylglutathione lyase family enzyme
MTIQHMEHVGIVVDDLAAATAFFVELGLKLQGEGPVEGGWVDRVVGLEGVRAEIAMMETPDGYGRPGAGFAHGTSPTSRAIRSSRHNGGSFSRDATSRPSSSTRIKDSPSRWRFRPPSPLTVRFRVEPSGWAST